MHVTTHIARRYKSIFTRAFIPIRSLSFGRPHHDTAAGAGSYIPMLPSGCSIRGVGYYRRAIAITLVATAILA